MEKISESKLIDNKIESSKRIIECNEELSESLFYINRSINNCASIVSKSLNSKYRNKLNSRIESINYDNKKYINNLSDKTNNESIIIEELNQRQNDLKEQSKEEK